MAKKRRTTGRKAIRKEIRKGKQNMPGQRPARPNGRTDAVRTA